MRNFKSYIMTGASVIILQACTMIPDLPQFGSPAPQSYPQSAAYDAPIMNVETGPILSDISWQNYFQDDQLKALISTGLENNRDLQLAALNIAEARALYGIERSAIFPDVNASGSYTRQKTPNAASATAVNNGTSTGGGIFETYSASLGISSYEIDLFGRLRSLSESALNEYFATEAAQENVRISLIANIATAYTNLIANKTLLNLAEETVEAQQDSYDIIALRAEEGIASDLELRQAEILLHQARADKFQFLYAATQSLNGLRLLLGMPDNMTELAALIPDDVSINALGNFTANIPAGLPADLLTNRPDIIRAEYLLKAANANIGAARAAFFPSISLTTQGGYASPELSGLFSSGSEFWQFSPQINIPIFTGGRLKNSLDVAEIRTQSAIVEYEQTIETAFREVSDALAAVSTYDDRIAAQEDLINATEDAANLSGLRFETGVESYLAVLDAERELYAARQNYIQQKAEQINAKINLYRSVGGGTSSDINDD